MQTQAKLKLEDGLVALELFGWDELGTLELRLDGDQGRITRALTRAEAEQIHQWIAHQLQL